MRELISPDENLPSPANRTLCDCIVLHRVPHSPKSDAPAVFARRVHRISSWIINAMQRVLTGVRNVYNFGLTLG